jgi:LPS export ABC transporter protein LptC
MILKISSSIIILTFLTTPVLGIHVPGQEQKKPMLSQESDQQINDFSLSGYGEKGKKDWDISGKTADILTEAVKLSDVVGNLYGKDEDTQLTAKKGDFNKTDGKLHLEQDVVITTSSGARLTTDSLDWDRNNQVVTTQDPVNIQKDNMVLVASGAKAKTSLKKVALEKDVRLDINPVTQDKSEGQLEKEKIVITCDGPLEIDYEKNIATFNNNVKVERNDTIIYSDTMDVYFIAANTEENKTTVEDNKGSSADITGNKIDRIVAKGNVKILRGENVSFSDEAIYTASDKKIVLYGRPKLVIYSTEELKDASVGN